MNGEQAVVNPILSHSLSQQKGVQNGKPEKKNLESPGGNESTDLD